MVADSWEERQPGEAYQVLLFQLPDGPGVTAIQDRFFLDKAFWKPYVAKMFLWTRPFALTKTETPDGLPALALLVNFTDHEDVLYQVGQEIAAALELPAFALTLTFLDDAMKADLLNAPRPW